MLAKPGGGTKCETTVTMSQISDISDAERLLDELEVMANSDVSSRLLVTQALSSIRTILQCQATQLNMTLASGNWLTLGQLGDIHPSLKEEFQSLVGSKRSVQDPLYLKVDEFSCFLVPLTSGDNVHGFLVTVFQVPVPADGISTVHSVMSAFAEVLNLRFTRRRAELLSENWLHLQRLIEDIFASNSIEQSADVFVNRAVLMFSAVRIGLATKHSISKHSSRMVAVSGNSLLDHRSPELKAMGMAASPAIYEGKPVMRQSTVEPANGSSLQDAPIDENGCFENLIALPLFNSTDAKSIRDQAIIIEWKNRDSMLETVPILTHFLPLLATVWMQNRYRLRLPRSLRNWSESRKQLTHGIFSGSVFRWIVVATIACFAFWGLMSPAEFHIEAEGVLEPIERRSIFSTADGYVEELFIEDGKVVKRGEILAKLRSPTLQLQIEESIGEIQALTEKKNGLRIASNQLNPSASDIVVTQTRISSDLLLVETQEKSAKKKLAYLNSENEKLTLIAPIDGIVLSKKLRSELESPPLRRGDSIFDIADLNGEWHLATRVADRDAGFVRKFYSDKGCTVDFIFQSVPDERFQAEVYYLSESLENAQGTGAYLSVLAKVESKIAEKAYIGANANVFYSCGREPLWYVWCRPILETIQRRLWLFVAPGAGSNPE